MIAVTRPVIQRLLHSPDDAQSIWALDTDVETRCGIEKKHQEYNSHDDGLLNECGGVDEDDDEGDVDDTYHFNLPV